jgi:hypothetical protein
VGTLTPGAAQERHSPLVVQDGREPIEFQSCGRDDWRRRQQAVGFGQGSIPSLLKRDVARHHDHGHTALFDCRPNCELESARHLMRAGDELTIVAALAEQGLGVRFLKITGTDLRRGNLRSDGEHRYARPMAVEEAIDEVEIAGSAAARADRESPRQVCLGPGCKRGDFLMANMDPLDLAATPERIREPVQTVPHDAVNTFHARRLQDLGELVCYGSRHGLHPRIEASGRVVFLRAGDTAPLQRDQLDCRWVIFWKNCRHRQADHRHERAK